LKSPRRRSRFGERRIFLRPSLVNSVESSLASPSANLIHPPLLAVASFFLSFSSKEKNIARVRHETRRRVSFRFENALARARTASGVFIRARFANRDSSAIFGARATARVSLCVYYERENAIGKISHRQSLRGCRPIKSTSTRSETRYDTRASTATINRKHRRDDEKGASREFQSTTRPSVLASDQSHRPRNWLEAGSSRAPSSRARTRARREAEFARARCFHARARERFSPSPSKRGTNDGGYQCGIPCQWVNYFASDLVGARASLFFVSFCLIGIASDETAFAGGNDI